MFHISYWSSIPHQGHKTMKKAHFNLFIGAGDYYCSGNDLSNFANIPPDGIAAMAKKGGEILEYVIQVLLVFIK